MKVIKLGGTSQSIIGYKKLLNIIINTLKDDEKLIIVLSAVSGVTNLLEKFINTNEIKYIGESIKKNQDLIDQLNNKFSLDINIYNIFNDLMVYSKSKNNRAAIIGFGEVMSTNIFYNFVIQMIPSYYIKLLNSYDFIISKLESIKLYPASEFECSDSIFKLLENYKIFITQGFIASSPISKSKILLGRGGSDTTGALIANTVNAEEYEVWTDVDGIYSADPRIISNSILIKEINYDIIQEMAGMGAKVMHPYSILPCKKKNIPIIIKNTFNDINNNCTIIKNSEEKVFSIASQKNITLFKITSLNMWDSYGFVYDIFKIFSDKKVNVNIITTSQFSISTTTDEKKLDLLNEIFEDLKQSYEVEMIHNRSIISIVSNKLNDIINKIDITKFEKDIIHFSSNNLTISFVLDENNTDNIIKILHSKLLSL